MTEGIELGRFVVALAGVLGLLLLLAWVARRGLPGLPKVGAGDPRLLVLAVRQLDARTRVVLLRRDDVEHLLAVGPAGTSLIETLPASRVVR